MQVGLGLTGWIKNIDHDGGNIFYSETFGGESTLDFSSTVTRMTGTVIEEGATGGGHTVGGAGES